MSSEATSYTFRQLEPPAGASGRSADDLLAAALAEADEIRERARAQGEADGRAAALATVRAEAEPWLQALGAAQVALDELRDQLVTELEADAVALALRLTEQIVSGSIDVAPERLIDVASVAMRRIADRRHVTLVVNPEDLDLMQESVQRLQSELGGIEHCSVQSDRRVGRGGVIARTEAGEIDATIDAQMSRVREIVAAELSAANRPLATAA